MNDKNEIFAQEVDNDELEAAVGGSRDYAAEGCSSTTELEGFCVFSDKCFSMITTYIHPKWTEPCPVCGNKTLAQMTSNYYASQDEIYCRTCGYRATKAEYWKTR